MSVAEGAVHITDVGDLYINPRVHIVHLLNSFWYYIKMLSVWQYPNRGDGSAHATA
jgi:hypothetical protein